MGRLCAVPDRFERSRHSGCSPYAGQSNENLILYGFDSDGHNDDGHLIDIGYFSEIANELMDCAASKLSAMLSL